MQSLKSEHLKMEYSFVMSDRISGKFLYINSEKQLYTYNADRKNPPGKTYRCKDRKCPARVIIRDDGECVYPPNRQPHNHGGDFEQKFTDLKGLEQVKSDLSNVVNVASGSRIADPRAVYKSAVIRFVH